MIDRGPLYSAAPTRRNTTSHFAIVLTLINQRTATRHNLHWLTVDRKRGRKKETSRLKEENEEELFTYSEAKTSVPGA